MDKSSINRVKLCSLWKNQSPNGHSYLSGSLGYDSIIEIWPNRKRDGKKDPDFQVFITTRIKKEIKSETNSDFSDAVTTQNDDNIPF